MTALRVAVAGLGNAAVNLHLPALAGLSDATIAGGCDPVASQRESASARFGFPAFADIDTMLRETKPDVVIISTPPATHVELCLAAFAGGAHVICEKPIASTVDDASRILDAAKAAGKRVAMNHEFREMPAFRAVLDAMRADGSGVVFAQAWQLMNLPPWAEPGWRGQLLRGTLYEAGIHLVDYMMAVFGEKPLAVSATMSTCGVREEDSDAVALVTLEFSRGRLAQIVQHRLCPGETQYFEVRSDTRQQSYRVSYGGRARLSAGLLRSTAPHVRFEFAQAGISWSERGHARTPLAKNPKDAPMIATRNLIQRTLAGFQSGGAVPASGEDGRDAIEVIAAAYLSATEGRRVALDGDLHGALRTMSMAEPSPSTA